MVLGKKLALLQGSNKQAIDRCHKKGSKTEETRVTQLGRQICACPKLGQLLHFFAGNGDARIIL